MRILRAVSLILLLYVVLCLIDGVDCRGGGGRGGFGGRSFKAFFSSKSSGKGAARGGGGSTSSSSSSSSSPSLQSIFLIIIFLVFGLAAVALVSKFIINYCCCPDQDYLDTLESQTKKKKKEKAKADSKQQIKKHDASKKRERTSRKDEYGKKDSNGEQKPRKRRSSRDRSPFRRRRNSTKRDKEKGNKDNNTEHNALLSDTRPEPSAPALESEPLQGHNDSDPGNWGNITREINDLEELARELNSVPPCYDDTIVKPKDPKRKQHSLKLSSAEKRENSKTENERGPDRSEEDARDYQPLPIREQYNEFNAGANGLPTELPYELEPQPLQSHEFYDMHERASPYAIPRYIEPYIPPIRENDHENSFNSEYIPTDMVPLPDLQFMSPSRIPTATQNVPSREQFNAELARARPTDYIRSISEPYASSPSPRVRRRSLTRHGREHYDLRTPPARVRHGQGSYSRPRSEHDIPQVHSSHTRARHASETDHSSPLGAQYEYDTQSLTRSRRSISTQLPRRSSNLRRQTSAPIFYSASPNFAPSEMMLRDAPPTYEESVSSHSLYEPD